MNLVGTHNGTRERYGRGGGFDERQSVNDYAKVQEDDDGYEFPSQFCVALFVPLT